MSITDLSIITSQQLIGILPDIDNRTLFVTTVVPPSTVDWTSRIPCILEVPEGIVAFPDVHTLVTQGSKITGMVMPTATDSTINFKVIVPPNLDSTANSKIRVYTLTLSANTSDIASLRFSNLPKLS